MREYLFRAKRKDGHGWVEGDFIHDRRVKTNEPVYSIWFFASENKAMQVDVDPETVGQYTGLIDKNGVKIFDGDILKDDWMKIYTVIFTTNSCSFMVECTVAPNEYEKGRYRLGDAWCETISVIGNIHDNPELLEGGGEE